MSNNNNGAYGGFSSFAIKRIAIGILLSIAILWILGIVFGFFEKPDTLQKARQRQELMRHETQSQQPLIADNYTFSEDRRSQDNFVHELGPVLPDEGGFNKRASAEITMGKDTMVNTHEPDDKAEIDHTSPSPASPNSQETTPPEKKDISPQTSHDAQEAPQPSKQAETHTMDQSIDRVKITPKGVKFVEAMISPLEYELEERWWKWRPNDILNFSDNVNNYQLGVLEVTRRTVVALAERLSRTGTTASFDGNLENAMNWFMVKATQYWFPSPERKYKASIEELRKYTKKLKNKKATFFTRPDNLIPLLMSYEDLLGSCDENLVKAREADGSDVSFFQSDDYFYYAQGVASTMATILEAVQHDFVITLESRHGAEVLHHAIESCHRARDINPLIVTEAGLDGILANHRANIAAPISHARFYLGVLIKTLST